VKSHGQIESAEVQYNDNINSEFKYQLRFQAQVHMLIQYQGNVHLTYLVSVSAF
jgi:hypothetical protein